MPSNAHGAAAAIPTDDQGNTPSISLLAVTDYGVTCRWNGIKVINSFLNKKTKYVDYRWIMGNDGEYSCVIYFSILRQFINVLDKHGVDTSMLKAIKIPENYLENERRVNGRYINVVGKTDDSLLC